MICGNAITVHKPQHGFVQNKQEKSALADSRKGFIGLADSWYFLLLDSSWPKMVRIIIFTYLFFTGLFTCIAYPFSNRIGRPTEGTYFHFT